MSGRRASNPALSPAVTRSGVGGSTVRRLVGELWPHRRAVTVAAVAATALALATAVYPLALELLTAKLIHPDGFALSERWQEWGRWAGVDPGALERWLNERLLVAFAAVVGLKAGAQGLHVYVWGRVTVAVVTGLRDRLFAHMLAQGPGYFAERKVGDLVSLFGGDMEEVERAVHQAVPVVLFDALKLAALATVSVLLYPGLLAVAVAVLVAAAVPIVVFARLLKRYAADGQIARAGLLQRVMEVIGRVAVVHANDAVAAEQRRFADAQRGYVGAVVRALRVRAIHTPLMEVLGVAATLATIRLAVTGGAAIRPSEAVGFLLAMVLMYEPLKNLARINGALMPGLAAADRIYAHIDRPPAVVDPPVPRRWTRRPTRARFEGVWFRYRPDGDDVLSGVDFTLREGRVTGLVGPSGAGKSTVARLLPRLYDPHRGRVTVDGIDVREVSLSALRSQIAVVTQDTFLFNASVRDNIAYGVAASDADVRAAAERAQAHEFIVRLPEGYSTPCGDRGVRLSGGQRQRIAIARAFLKDAPLLILDEATSALAPEQERGVLDALAALVDRRAVLLIAHRGSMLELCHERISLEDGRIRGGAEVKSWSA